MQVALVNVDVKEENISAFIEATRWSHQASALKIGNRWFDMRQSDENPGYFILYEVSTAFR